MRTPRPSHPGLSVEWVSGRIVDGPRERMRDNVDEGADALEGLDLPYPHRAGSSICCPTSTLSALVLGVELREAYEVDGELSRALVGRLERLAAHLRSRHRVEGLASTLGADDFDAAFQITGAGHSYCAKYLSDWQESAEVAAAFRKVERKKERSRKASKRRRDSKARGEGNSRAVKALLKQSRKVPRSAGAVDESPYQVGLRVGLAGGSVEHPKGAVFYDDPRRNGGRWEWESWEDGVAVGRETRRLRASRAAK